MATLEAMAARLRALGPHLTREAMPEFSAAISDELRASIASGVTPWGEPWAARKEGGGRVLANAFDAVGVAAVGTLLVVRLGGVEARHHYGRIRGHVQRKIIPTGWLPPSWDRALKRVLDRRFTERANG